MTYPASTLILVFFAITYIQSSYDKVFHWKENVAWLKEHFSKSIIKNQVPASLFLLLVLELISGILCVVGTIELLIFNSKTSGFYGAVFSSITLILMLFGQRLAKDYDGARNITIYFIPAVLAVFWLS